MTTRVGVLLPTREQAMTGDFGASPLLEFARRAEDLGFDSLWTGDSLTARPRLDPLVVLAAAGAATSRITLGTAALTPALRHPLIGANMVAGLDHVCGSRLVLGLGSGFPLPETQEEFAAVGAPFTARAARLDENAALWRTAWNAARPDRPTAFKGRYWQAEGLDRLPPPHRPGGPPLWLAGSDTPRVLARVARHYDGWLPFLPTAEAYGTAWREIGRLAAREGRPAGAITPALYATVTLGADRESARQELEHYIEHYYGRPLDFMATIQAYAWGDAEEVARWLAGYVRAGARHIVLRVGSLTPLPHLQQIAEAIVPALRRLP
ncbi:LLM class flavin-dependent oxidoreductase [Streptomyces sp. SL13]|uniref:LLM class flavin-dependent oxidoreductase n=1 Tax=Streptantibioticus silvisoli TaxID=2705255 RepID=A0AA90H2P5_9ACTN|nr:LLM class flavin-dependent oxidoreductase [Streptantibioticus silvisoli]MDI5962487.1 LLM class flavin-dependent oxidoreductase [Streptantibioticus silvisoli]MDI5969122.1 LLM class flavin-dependent oxidoreductase [Streptantibioticus silvisoli]